MKVEIPPYILNEGNYSIDLWMGLIGTEAVDKVTSKAVTFAIDKSNIDHIIKTIPGIIRSKLNYHNTFIGNE
jgi:hypothetical protein